MLGCSRGTRCRDRAAHRRLDVRRRRLDASEGPDGGRCRGDDRADERETGPPGPPEPLGDARDDEDFRDVPDAHLTAPALGAPGPARVASRPRWRRLPGTRDALESHLEARLARHE